MHPYGTCHPVTLTIKLTEIWSWTGEPNIQVRASFVRSKYKATDTISGATVLAEPLKRLLIKSWFVLKMIRNSDFCDSSSCCDKSCRYTHEKQAAWQRRIVADIALGWKNDFIIFRVGLRYSSTQATDATRPISTYTCADSKTEVDIRKMPIAEWKKLSMC